MRAEGEPPEPLTEGDDVILKTVPDEDDPSSGYSGSPPDMDMTVWGWRNVEDRDTRYRGWLPGAGLFTIGEVLVGIVVAVSIYLVVAASLPLLETYVRFPEPVAGDETFVSRACGLASGICVVVRRRSSRIARRARLRGER